MMTFAKHLVEAAGLISDVPQQERLGLQKALTDEWRAALEKLREPFDPTHIKWRVGRTTKSGQILLLCYVDARLVQERLDAVTPWWQSSYAPHPLGNGVVCTLSLSLDGVRYVTRSDGADPSSMEREKGVLSDAFKRAAVQFGVARYLYRFPEVPAVMGVPGNQANGFHKGAYWRVPDRAYEMLGVKRPEEGDALPEEPESQSEQSPGDVSGTVQMDDIFEDVLRGIASSHDWESLLGAVLHAMKSYPNPCKELDSIQRAAAAKSRELGLDLMVLVREAQEALNGEQS